MNYLVFRVPSDVRLTNPYQLSDNIRLETAPRITTKDGWFASSFYYVEENPPTEPFGPPNWMREIVSYRNLREFITFWVFVRRNHAAIKEFETGEGPQVLNAAPASEEPTGWNHTPDLDPDRFEIQEASARRSARLSSPNYSIGSVEQTKNYRTLSRSRHSGLTDTLPIPEEFFTPTTYSARP